MKTSHSQPRLESQFVVPGRAPLTTGVARSAWLLSGLTLATATVFALGCEAVGVGDPCIPEDEYRDTFAGYASSEVNVESRSFQCETRVCLVNNFQGRVSCPYGQDDPADGQPATCKTPDGTTDIAVAVKPQLLDRRPEDAVYCSCRCDGPQPNAPYCECPDGFSCEELLSNLGLGNAQLAGSYCVRDGTHEEDPRDISPAACELEPTDCGPANEFF